MTEFYVLQNGEFLYLYPSPVYAPWARYKRSNIGASHAHSNKPNREQEAFHGLL